MFLAINSPAAESDKEMPLPDLELIEFLGSFTTDDGEWIDPLGFIGDDNYLDMADKKYDPSADDQGDAQNK